MNEIELLRSEAEQEWERNGVLSVSTYIALTNLGVDAEAFIADLEG